MKFRSVLLSVLVVMLALAGCRVAPLQQDGGETNIQVSDFGRTKSGQQVELYTLTNANGLVAKIATYGGTVTELWVPDRNGQLGDIVLGFDNIRDYEEKSSYFGSIIGRYGNRIGNAAFVLDGKAYSLNANDGNNHLHGGLVGFDKVVWDAKPFQTPDGVGLKLRSQQGHARGVSGT